MKITDFEIGKRYRHPDWQTTEFVALQQMGNVYSKLCLFAKDGSFIEPFVVFKHHLNDRWLEIEEEEESMKGCKDYEAELSRVKLDLSITKAHLSACQNYRLLQDNLLAKYKNEINELKDQLAHKGGELVEANHQIVMLKDELYEFKSKQNILSNMVCKKDKEIEELQESCLGLQSYHDRKLSDAMAILKMAHNSNLEVLENLHPSSVYAKCKITEIDELINNFLNNNKD